MLNKQSKKARDHRANMHVLKLKLAELRQEVHNAGVQAAATKTMQEAPEAKSIAELAKRDAEATRQEAVNLKTDYEAKSKKVDELLAKLEEQTKGK